MRCADEKTVDADTEQPDHCEWEDNSWDKEVKRVKEEESEQE